MDDLIDRVEISGSALALALRELGSHTETDGLLFGRLHTRSIQNFQDDGDSPAAPTRREEHTAIITGCCCSGTLMSFYDAAGKVDDRKLDRLLGNRQKWGGDAIIGWLLGRRSSSMRPSMRETAITASLNSRNPSSPAPLLDHHHRQKKVLENSAAIDLGLPYATSSRNSNSSDSSMDRQDEMLGARGDAPALAPCLFLLLTEMTAENSIQTHEYRAFQFQRRTRQFHPRLLVVRNVGRAGRSSEQGGLYGSFVPVSPLPWFPTSVGSSSSGSEDEEVDSWRSSNTRERSSSLRQQQQQALLGMYAEGFSIDRLQNVARCGGGVQEIELLYSRMLSKMQKITQEVRQSSEALQEKKLKIARLRASQDHL